MSYKNTVKQEIISEKTRKLMLYFHLVIAGRIVLVLALSPRGVIEIIFNSCHQLRPNRNRIPAGQWSKEIKVNEEAGCIEKQTNVALCE